MIDPKDNYDITEQTKIGIKVFSNEKIAATELDQQNNKIIQQTNRKSTN